MATLDNFSKRKTGFVFECSVVFHFCCLHFSCCLSQILKELQIISLDTAAKSFRKALLETKIVKNRLKQEIKMYRKKKANKERREERKKERKRIFLHINPKIDDAFST